MTEKTNNVNHCYDVIITMVNMVTPIIFCQQVLGMKVEAEEDSDPGGENVVNGKNNQSLRTRAKK